MRRLRGGCGVLALASAAPTLTGCGSGGVLRGPEETPRPVVTRTVAPPPGGATSARPAPSGRRVSFRGIGLRLPAGWRLAPPVGDATCALPPHQVSCLGGPLMIKTVRSGEWPGGGALDRPSGWQGSAPPVCYAADAVPPDHADQAHARLAARGAARAADGTALAFRQWEVPCSSGRSFTVKLWYATTRGAVFYTLSANPLYAEAYQQIVTSARF
jgi:hypothetical protein